MKLTYSPFTETWELGAARERRNGDDANPATFSQEAPAQGALVRTLDGDE